MKLLLFDRNKPLCEAWHRSFADWQDDIDIFHGDLLEVANFHWDCLVSPANSFGIMDGGIDLAIRNLYPEVQQNVTWMVKHRFNGEQPVGTCELVPLGGNLDRLLAHTPTMRHPRRIEAVQVYDAMRAMLLAVDAWNEQVVIHNADVKLLGNGRLLKPVETVACPGLGTATGGVSYERAAKAMELAYGSVQQKEVSYETWDEAGAKIALLEAL